MIASVMTAAALVVVVIVGPLRQEAIETNLVADLGLLTAEESLEFFEDIDFYEWLSTVEGRMVCRVLLTTLLIFISANRAWRGRRRPGSAWGSAPCLLA